MMNQKKRDTEIMAKLDELFADIDALQTKLNALLKLLQEKGGLDGE